VIADEIVDAVADRLVTGIAEIKQQIADLKSRRPKKLMRAALAGLDERVGTAYVRFSPIRHDFPRMLISMDRPAPPSHGAKRSCQSEVRWRQDSD